MFGDLSYPENAQLIWTWYRRVIMIIAGINKMLTGSTFNIDYQYIHTVKLNLTGYKVALLQNLFASEQMLKLWDPFDVNNQEESKVHVISN